MVHVFGSHVGYANTRSDLFNKCLVQMVPYVKLYNGERHIKLFVTHLHIARSYEAIQL